MVNTVFLARKFNNAYAPLEIEKFFKVFCDVDKHATGCIDPHQFASICNEAGETYPDAVVLSAIKEVDSNHDKRVSFEEFLAALLRCRNANAQVNRLQSNKKVHSIQGSNENIIHGISEDEKESFTQHVNERLIGDQDIGKRLPIALEGMHLFTECRDGLLLCKLINDSVPNTIDERVLNKGKLSTFQILENQNVVINSAKAIGCNVINIGAQDLVDGKEHLVLGLIWQIIRIGLNAKIDIRIHPELFRLLEQGETLEDLVRLPPDSILLRWFNYHLKKAGWDRRVTNFSGDIKDSENYTVLLNQLAPHACTKAPLYEKDLRKRAELVLEGAAKIGCRKYVNPRTICNGNSKLNFAFIANLFNNCPGLEPLSEQEKAALDDALFNSSGDREARAFALWMNSLGVEPFVYSIFDDLRDGLVLLQTFDAIHPGIVDWKKVNKNTASRFKKVENTNYAVVLGKSLRFSLVNIQGADITDGSRTLTLGLVWQMMRDHIVQTLHHLSSNAGKEIRDEDIIRWANDCVKRTGKTTTINSFKDPALRSGVFLIDLCNGITKGIVDYDLVTPGAQEDEAKLNAKYAISIARKLGATIFVLPEDIVEVNSKMILTFVGTLMAVDRQRNKAKQ